MSDAIPSGNNPVWPPPPTNQPADWPPAPGQTPGTVVYFESVYLRSPGPLGRKAIISDFRTGALTLTPEGILIQGKAVLPSQTRTLILLGCLLLLRVGVIVAHLVIEYALRKDMSQMIPWAYVREIAVSPKKPQACFVYEGVDQRGKMRSWSLAFKAQPMMLEAFANDAQDAVPQPLTREPLKSGTSPVLLGILLALIAVMLAGALYAVLKG